jgi:uncharacterized membrane protein
MLVLSSFLAAVGIAVIVITAFFTATNYDELPARIPTHFGFSPEPDGYGPKPMAWMLPIVQSVVVVICAWVAYQKPVSDRELFGVLGVADSVVLTLFAAQWLIIETARNGPSVKRFRTFWLIFVLTVIVVPVSAFFGK